MVSLVDFVMRGEEKKAQKQMGIYERPEGELRMPTLAEIRAAEERKLKAEEKRQRRARRYEEDEARSLAGRIVAKAAIENR